MSYYYGFKIMIYKGFEIIEFFGEYVVYLKKEVVFQDTKLTSCKNWIEGNLQKNLQNGKEIAVFSENYLNGKSGVLLDINENSFKVSLFDGKKGFNSQLLLPQTFEYRNTNFRSK